MQKVTVASFTNNDGAATDVSIDMDLFGSQDARVREAIDASYETVEDETGEYFPLLTLRAKPQIPELFGVMVGNEICNAQGYECELSIASLNPGSFGLVPSGLLDGIENVDGATVAIFDKEMIADKGEGNELVPVTIFDLGGFFTLVNTETKAPITLKDILGGLLLSAVASLSGAKDLIARMRGGDGLISVRSNPLITDLGRTNTKRQELATREAKPTLYEDPITIVEATTGQTRVTFTGIDTDEIILDAQSDRILTTFLAMIPGDRFYGDGSVTVKTTQADLMRIFGLKDRKSARKLFSERLNTLYNASIDRVDPGKEEVERIRVCEHFKYGRGGIEFTFTRPFLSLGVARNAFTQYLDERMLQYNAKNNPAAWSIYKKLANHSNTNTGQANEYVLSVPALLDYVREIPSEDEVSKTPARQFTLRIIKPLERDLNYLTNDLGVLTHWDYCHSKGAPLTDDEQALRIGKDGQERPLDWSVAKDLYITWGLDRRPDRERELTARNDGRQKRIEAADKNRKKRERYEDKKMLAKAEREGVLEAEREAAERDAANSKPDGV